MTLKASGRTKPQKDIKIKNKVKCPYCQKSFRVKVDDFECDGCVVFYYCQGCGEVFDDSQI